MSEGLILFKQNYLAPNTRSGKNEKARLSKMYQKQKGLAMQGKNLAKMHIVETKIVGQFHSGQSRRKKRGEKWGQLSLSY
jgi:hypothetical protein